MYITMNKTELVGTVIGFHCCVFWSSQLRSHWVSLLSLWVTKANELIFFRNFSNFVAVNWRTFSPWISWNRKLNCNIFLILLCIFGSKNVCWFSGNLFLSANFQIYLEIILRDWWTNVMLTLFRSYLVLMGHSGCSLAYHVSAYALLSW